MKLLGLSGTNGSGKDSVGNILRDTYSYLFISVTDLLRTEATARGLSTERENLSTISAEWRRAHGLGVLIDKAIELYEQQGGDKKFSGLVIASLRNPGEADRVHELGGEVIWLDADSKVRYNRIYTRGRTDDNKTFEQFLSEEQAEMQHSGDEATLSMQGVKEKADKTVINNDTDLSQLQVLVSEICKP